MTFTLKNHTLYFGDKDVLISLPEGIKIHREIEDSGCFLLFSKSTKFAAARWKGIRIAKLNRYIALYRKKAYWYGPYFGCKECKVPELTTILWIERRDGLILVLAPLINKGYNCYINGKEEGIEVLADNNCSSGNTNELIALYIGLGKDFYDLTEKAAETVSSFVNVGLLRKEKGLPKWVDWLGYCTWNTFYKKINQENVTRMLQHIVKKNKIKLGYILLDDGWQVIKHFALFNKGADKNKFPDGFGNFIDLIKKSFAIKEFLVWHTLQGYWGGITLRGPYGKRFNTKSTQFHRGPSYPTQSNFWVEFFEKTGSNWYPISKYLKLPVGISLPSEMNELWDDYYTWLSSQGVTGVKVDNQAGNEIVTYNLGYQATLMRKFHRVLEEQVSKHFSKYSIINCMSMNVNVFYQLFESNITRNSDDYFPNNEDSQPEHVIINAYNNLWCGHFSLPDWDMFQSNHPWGTYQAASRAISGSPVYFADDFKTINPEVISRIALPNGRLLRCENPSLVCKDLLFSNPAKPGRALKIFNHNNYNSVLGIFNVLRKRGTFSSYSPCDVENLNPNDKFAVFGIEAQSLRKMDYTDKNEIQLHPREFEIFVISPIKNGFAPLGMIDKFNPGGIFESVEYQTNKIIIKVIYGGILGFYSETSPSKILIENKAIKYKYKSEESFLSFESEPNENQIIEIEF